MALDLNMGYCNIDISPKSRDLKTLVKCFGTFGYNRVPMGLCNYGEIFQAKVDELIGGIKGVKTYIDNIIVLGKGSFYQHIDQPRVIFYRLRCRI